MLSSIPAAIRDYLSGIQKLTLTSFAFSSGGCINHGGKLTTRQGIFFLKWNDATKYPGMFAAEAKGLSMLSAPAVINMPRVILFGEAAPWQFIMLEFVSPEPEPKNYWVTLGAQLSGLHRVTAGLFGLDHNNFIGSLPQSNAQSPSWVDFFIDRRLKPQLGLGLRSGAIPAQIARQFDTLFNRLPSFFPQEPPALLHGDLWSGNLITGPEGAPYLIDPAVYFGHREAELAFTGLFGGFPAEFYAAYNENFPLAAGFQERISVYNLYPLLVHVNLFGSAYLGQVVSILRHYV